MFTVNITFKVDHAIFDKWLLWMKQSWLIELSESCDSAHFQLHQLIGHDDDEGTNVVIQLSLPTREMLNNYLENIQPVFQQKQIDRWHESVLFFQTVLTKL